MALLWQGTRDVAQTLLLESVSPNRIEILSLEQFQVAKHNFMIVEMIHICTEPCALAMLHDEA